MDVTAYSIAKNFIGMKEVPGMKDNPFIVWCLSTCGFPEMHDEVPWCSAFVNGIAFILGLSMRSNSAMARSWLLVGDSVELDSAGIGFDVCIFKRGTGWQGHVGFFGGIEDNKIKLLGGNQKDSVSEELFETDRLLGIRRLV